MYRLKESSWNNPFGLYSVAAGDTLLTVSEKVGLPPAVFVRAAGLKELPKEGTLLVLPSREGELYTVEAGETLDSLCKKMQVSREDFVRLNGCAYVYPTQKVLLPPRGTDRA